MKKILTFSLLFVALAFASCGKKEPKLLDPNAVLSIRPAKGVQLRSNNPEHLSALEIVKQCNAMMVILHDTGRPSIRGWADAQKDLNPEDPRLKMWGTDIITSWGTLEKDFIKARDVVFVIDRRSATSNRIDTIAYIPNKTLIEAYNIIKPAYDRGDYETVYSVFDQAYRFIPITGQEWRALKEQGQE